MTATSKTMRFFIAAILSLSTFLHTAEALRYPPSASGSGKLSLPVKPRRGLKDSPPKDKDDIPTTPPTLVPGASPTLQSSPSPTENEKKKDEDDDDEVGEAVEDTESPTLSPTLFPTTIPTSTPTTQPTDAPTKAPTLRPTKSPTLYPTTSSPSSSSSPTLSFDPSSGPSLTESPSVELATASPILLLTTSVDLETFEMAVVWENGFPTAQGLEQQLEADMRAYFPIFFASFVDVELQTDGVQIDETRRRQLQSTYRASIELSGRMLFDGTEEITQDQVWSLQSEFLESYTLPADNNVQLESITLDSGTTFTSDATGPDGTDRGVQVQEEESSGSFSAYGTVVGALVAGISFAFMGGVYYLRRSRGEYKARDRVPFAELYEMDPEENSTICGKPFIEVDTNDRGGVGNFDSTTPTTLGSESSEIGPDALSPSSANGDSRFKQSPKSTLDEQISSQSLLSGVLPSLVEENSHEVIAETNNEGLVAEVGDENLDLSVMVDADEEFAALPADNELPNSTAVVDAFTYSNWVTPLLRHFRSSARDCCVKGAVQNVMDTTMSHDLLVSDVELAEQRQRQMLASDAPLFDANIDDAEETEEMVSTKNNTASPSNAEGAVAEAGHPEDETVPDTTDHPADEIELTISDKEEDNGDDSNNPLRLYPAKYQPHTTIYRRLSNAATSEDSSLNLSQQESFMTDDLDVDADLLEKALRDVTLYHPHEEDNTEIQVEEYMHQVRREAIELQRTIKKDEGVKEVTL